jgi:hypothetical protein
MEDILDLYAQEADPLNPRLCFDERPCLMIGDVTSPIAMQAGKAKKIDYEYLHGQAVVALLAYNMDTGQRHVVISDTKTKMDYAQFFKWLLATHYPTVQSIKLVQDNLNTHTKGAFYKAFPPQEARELTKKLDFHFTPKHGSWLNMAEIEFAALSTQCLSRRIPNKETFVKEVAAWEKRRNEKATKINWSFTAELAREKLERHYKKVYQSN